MAIRPPAGEAAKNIGLTIGGAGAPQGRERRKSMPGGEDFVQMTQAPGEIARNVQDQNAILSGHFLVETMERAGGDLENDGRLDGLGRGGARGGFEDAHFSEEILFPQDGQLRLVALAKVFNDANGSASDQEHAVIGLSFPGNNAAAGKSPLFRLFQKQPGRRFVETGKDGNRLQELVHAMVRDYQKKVDEERAR